MRRARWSAPVLAATLYYMGRPSKYDADDVLDVAAELVDAGGPAALTISGVADRLGAPSGSIYHRFRSRDVVAASLWLRTVQRFQESWLVAADHPDPRAATRAAAAHVLDWSRRHRSEAALLLLHRSSDLLTADWPPELVEHNERLRAQFEQRLAELTRRLGAVTPAEHRRVRFAVVDIPYGAVRAPLAAGKAPEPELDEIVDDAVVAVVDRISAGTKP